VVEQLTQVVEAYKHTQPGDDFALLHHRQQFPLMTCES